MQLLKYPDPVLYSKSHPVEKFDKNLNDLVLHMQRTMIENYGIGLSAIQIGVLSQIFIYFKNVEAFEDYKDLVGEKDYTKELLDNVEVVINPKLEITTQETEIENEGCLSIMRLSVPVERFTACKLDYQNLNKEEKSIELTGLNARIIQHEFDHLQGTLITNRTKDKRSVYLYNQELTDALHKLDDLEKQNIIGIQR